MADLVIQMDAAEARERIVKSELQEAEQARYLQFVAHFSGARFYANTLEALEAYQEEQRVRLPAWFFTYRRTLAEAYAGAADLAVQFGPFADPVRAGARRWQLEGRWYTLSLPGLPAGKKERQALLNGSPSIRLFPFAVDTEDDRYQLGINLHEADTVIYEYHLEDVQASFSSGEDSSLGLFPVFASPGDLLSRICQIRHDGQIEISSAS